MPNAAIGYSTPGLSGIEPYIMVQDQKAQNTSGGTFTSGADQTRDLNTIVTDTHSLATLDSNVLTLPGGVWRCLIMCPATNVDRHQAWLRNDTDGTVLLRGGSSVCGTVATEMTLSVIQGRFLLPSPKGLKVMHRCQTTSATRGFGYEANFGIEIFTTAEFWKVG